jgi:predicted dehydrogenase
MAVYNDLASEEPIRIFDKGLVPPEDVGEPQEIPMSYRYGDIRAPWVLFEEPLNVQDREFVACVLAGRQPRTNADNGMAVVRVLEAASLSLEIGAPVQLGETPRPGAAERQLATAL